MKFFKKNQIIIYVIALMLVTAGYLNYTTNHPDSSLLVSTDPEELAGISNLGDAQLVNGNLSHENQSDSNNQKADQTTNSTNKEATQNKGEENQTKQTNTTNTTNETSKTNANTSNNNSSSGSSGSSVATNSGVTNNNYFVSSKLERDTMYSQMIETYEKVLNSANALETQKQTATDEITKINQTKNSIMICENLIKTKGFEQNIVFVNGESVSVIIGAQEIKPEEVAQIQNIISRELTSKAENIHIATK